MQRHALLLLLGLALALCAPPALGQLTPPTLLRRPARQLNANAPDAAQCLADLPGCATCVKNATRNIFMCSACLAPKYAPLDWSGYLERGGVAFVNEPFCNGACMNYKYYGTLLEADGTSPCVNCADMTGCGLCKQGSFKSPDTLAMFRYNLPNPAMQCETCGYCALNKCTAASGCTQCDVNQYNVRYPMLKVPAAPQPEVNVCIADLCVDYNDDPTATPPTFRPANLNLYSYNLNCARRIDPTNAASTVQQCTDGVGCTACKPGYFRTRNPIVNTTALCTPCEGCGTLGCGPAGCLAGKCHAALPNRISHPWGLKNFAGETVFVCRNATNQTTPLKTRFGLPTFSTWPASEFGNCGARMGEFQINWWQSGAPSDLTPAKWWDGTKAEFQSNGTVKITFEFINSNTRVKITLQYIDEVRQVPITKTIWGAFPVSQDRVCITLDNQIVFNDLNKDMAMQLYFITPAISNKRIQLRLTGEPSLTSPADPFGNTFAGGKVTIFGKRPADAGWSTVASVAQGINWKAADWVRLVIYPQENEWPALAVKSGVK